MNFEKIPPVPTTTAIIDFIFQRARENAKESKPEGNQKDAAQKKEVIKLDTIRDTLANQLDRVTTTFPNTQILPPFYIKLMHLTLDFPLFKQSLGSLQWAKKRAATLHKEYVNKILKAPTIPQSKKLTLEFYGRLCSILKQIRPNLEYLESARRTMRMYPDIKDMFTVAIYGFPNVGKTTLLNTLTGTKAQVAAYAFTTKSINAGYITLDGIKIQILDVPGTLDRPEKRNPIEMQAELVATDLAGVLIYVFDPSETCGFSFNDQKKLYHAISAKQNVLVYISKQDLLEKKHIEKFPYKALTQDQIKTQILELARLKEQQPKQE